MYTFVFVFLPRKQRDTALSDPLLMSPDRTIDYLCRQQIRRPSIYHGHVGCMVGYSDKTGR